MKREPVAPKTGKEIESLDDPRAAFDGEEPNVTPEEQQLYDAVVYKAMQFMYAEDMIVPLLEKLKGGAQNISKEIGHTAAMIMTSIVQTFDDDGQEIEGEILFNAGGEVVSQLVDIAVAGKIVAPEQEQDVAEAALYEGLRIWGQNMGRDGKITDEMAMDAKEQLRRADIQQGALPGREYGAPEAQPAAGAALEKAAGPQPAPTPMPQQGIVNQAAGA